MRILGRKNDSMGLPSKECGQDTKSFMEKRQFTPVEAEEIGNALGIRWTEFDVEQFTMGLNVELEHGRRDETTDVTYDDPMLTGKIALAHLNEIPNYYTLLAVMERDGKTQNVDQQKGA
jgi:hypothetical protein